MSPACGMPDLSAPAIARVDDRRAERERMVAEQIESRGIRDRMVLEEMREVPREAFLPASRAGHAYDDSPVPIGQGQTISQPYMVALMVSALRLKPTDRVLEVGTGSGYGAAVLSRLAAEVYTVERLPSLAHSARKRLGALGYASVQVREGDGSLGWREHAPYDGIVVTAAASLVPPALLEQLGIGGRLIMPVGRFQSFQKLVRVTKNGDDDYEFEQLMDVAFVPLVGAEGWAG